VTPVTLPVFRQGASALYLGPATAEFLEHYSDLKIKLTVSDRFIDPTKEGST
jgi:hypothetical protein